MNSYPPMKPKIRVEPSSEDIPMGEPVPLGPTPEEAVIGAYVTWASPSLSPRQRVVGQIVDFGRTKRRRGVYHVNRHELKGDLFDWLLIRSGSEWQKWVPRYRTVYRGRPDMKT